MKTVNQEALSRFIEKLKQHQDFQGNFVHHRHIPPQPPAFGSEVRFENPLRNALNQCGIDKLYSHQVEAIKHARQGSHVIVATPTASGKSLIYNLVVLEAVLKDAGKKALYIFPLKALEQDQMKNLRPWLSALGEKHFSAEIYDGDTSAYKRKKIRLAPPQILFTTPDMLHHGILAHHESWKLLLEKLAFVVLDEVHTYRGIFGSHVNQLLRRLKRLCTYYGSCPQFVLLSATVSNPKAFAQWLIQEEAKVVVAKAAPGAHRHFLFLNPPQSANYTATKLFIRCIERGFRTIVFTQSRKVTELMHLWASQMAPDFGSKISSYRAGFMPEERRGIEQKLASGRLLGVISTSALEMGIDIGFLDICLLVGYPGTVINTWQRGGRVGRSGRASAVILVAKPDALDQYFMKYPDDFFQRSYEAAVLDPDNPHVLGAHLPCAADEIPITMEDEIFWPNDFLPHLEALEKKGVLRRTVDGDAKWFSTKRRPHRYVNMRSAGESFAILDKKTGKPIGTADGIRAFKECHPGAVYLHLGRQYVVDELDIAKKNIRAYVSDVQYFTRVQSDKETEILNVRRSRPVGQFIVREGHLKVTETITGYEKRALSGHTLLGTVPLELPPQVFETVGMWIEIENAIRDFIDEKGHHFMGGIHAVEHGAIGMFPLFCLCDRDDIGGIAYEEHPELEKGAVFIYDGYPGGVGLAQRGYEIIEDLLEKTYRHIQSCPCDEGCPSCIHSPKCGSGNKPLDKQAALLVLASLLGHIPLRDMPKRDTPRTAAHRIPKRTPTKRTEPHLVFFDLETQKTAEDVGGWRNIHLMQVSVAVVFDTIQDRFYSYDEDHIEDLLDHLEKADLVVGFNVKRFDYTVLSAYTNRSLDRLQTFDILEDIYRRLGFRISLDHLAKETLQNSKTADGLQAVTWFKQGDMERLTAYCENDVAITRDLFYFGLKNAYLVYREKRENQRLRLLVDWNLEDILKQMP